VGKAQNFLAQLELVLLRKNNQLKNLILIVIKKDKPLINKRLGILGKGGSGKSTVTALLSQALRDLGYQVCVLDSDSTNAGLYRALGFSKSPAPLLDYFGGTEFGGGLVSCPVDDPTILPKAEVSLNKLHSKYYSEKSGMVLLTAGKIGGHGPGAGCDGPISKITRDFKIRDIGDCPVTLIDVKAGLEDFARGIVTSMDLVITVVDPSVAAMQIAGEVKVLIGEIKKGKLPATKHLKSDKLVKRANEIYKKARIKDSFALLNKVENKKEENYMREKLEEKNIKIIGVIPQTSSVSLSWLKGQPLEDEENKNNARLIVKKIETEVAD
jgi:CO dehydrogenase maturation factor